MCIPVSVFTEPIPVKGFSSALRIGRKPVQALFKVKNSPKIAKKAVTTTAVFIFPKVSKSASITSFCAKKVWKCLPVSKGLWVLDKSSCVFPLFSLGSGGYRLVRTEQVLKGRISDLEYSAEMTKGAIDVVSSSFMLGAIFNTTVNFSNWFIWIPAEFISSILLSTIPKAFTRIDEEGLPCYIPREIQDRMNIVFPCALTGEPVRFPIRLNGKIYERRNLALKLLEDPRFENSDGEIWSVDLLQSANERKEQIDRELRRLLGKEDPNWWEKLVEKTKKGARFSADKCLPKKMIPIVGFTHGLPININFDEWFGDDKKEYRTLCKHLLIHGGALLPNFEHCSVKEMNQEQE